MDFTSQPYRGSSRQIDEKDGPPKIKIFDADIAYQKFTWDGRDPRHLVAIYKPADLTMEEFVGWWYKKVSPRLQNGKHSLYIVAMDQLHHNGKNVPAVAIKCTATEKSVDLDKYFAELRERQKAHNVRMAPIKDLGIYLGPRREGGYVKVNYDKEMKTPEAITYGG